MTEARRCPQCSADLPVDAPEGLCPRCLLQQGIGEGSGSPASAGNEPTLAPRTADSGGAALGSHLRYFGDYEIVEEIARGGMGVVYKARQVSLDRVVALKMILAGQLASASDVERFYVEAKAAANLQHPNIVAIHEIGQHEGQNYFSMDYVEGQSLALLVRENPLPATRAAGYVKTIAEAIEFAHRQGTLHRDLKPSNILIDAFDQPRVTDFGLAKRIEADAQLTSTGSLLGTPSYMSPEQAGASGGKLGPASDVYSLGAVLYELVTGRPPFLAESLVATLNHVLNTEPVSPRLVNPNVPRDLETICLKCLQKDPLRRYPSSEELAKDLGRFLRGEPIQARPIGKTARLWRWCKRKPLVASLAALAASLLIAVIVVTAVGYFATSAALDRSEHTLYAAHMNLADEARRTGDDGRLVDLLERHLPQPGHADLRGWEWDYLRNQSRILTTIKYKTNLSKVDPWWLRFLGSTGQQKPSLALRSLAWSPDGRSLAGATWAGIQIWEPESGNEICTLNPPAKWIAWNTDGRRLAAAGLSEPELVVWDTVDRTRVLTLGGRSRGYTGELLGFAWSRDGRRLALATFDRRIEIWDASSGAKLLTLAGHPKDAGKSAYWRMLLAWSPDDKQLLSSGDSETKVWDVTSGRELRTLACNAIGCSPDFTRVADSLFVYDIASGHQRFNFERTAFSLAWSANGRRLATGIANTTKILDAETGKVILSLVGRPNQALALRPDGERLATGFDQVTIWDTTARNKELTLANPRGELVSVAWSPDGRRIAGGATSYIPPNALKGTVDVWDSESGAVVKSLEWQASPEASAGPIGMPWIRVAWSPDGARLASIDGSGTVKIWSTTNWQLVPGLAQLPPYSGGAPAEGRLDWSPDGKWLAAASGWTTLKIWESETGHEVFHYGEQGKLGIQLVGWSKKSGELSFGTLTETRSWNPVSGRLRAVGGSERSHIYFSPDEQLVAIPDGAEIIVLNVRMLSRWLSPPRILRGHTDHVFDIDWSPDGRRLVSSSQDRTAKIWDISSGQELLTFGGTETIPYRAVAFSPDGNRLAVSRGNTARILDARSKPADKQP
ncbi:MAG TPA: serine/threonine-protein kinase [Planctomycetaceae bacterium]|jgi:WD40 repeat protein/tRNA A-37 threonylcarbamoyl transferase component Bud32|nr:serine/threonine-protein kinase [Planctomycetaceae bacterium]